MLYKKFTIIFLISSILLSILFYLLTKNLILSIIALSIYIICFIYVSLFIFKKYEDDLIRINECINFINKFIISLSFNPSLSNAIDSCGPLINDKRTNSIKKVEGPKEKLNELEKIYNMEIFEIFLGFIDQYIENGGNILTYTLGFLSETRRLQSLENSLKKLKISGFISFIFMWIFSFIILIIARFSLNSFYQAFISNDKYAYIIFIGFIFYAITVLIYFIQEFKIKFIKRGKYNETKK